MGAANRAPITRDCSRRKRWIPSPLAAALSRAARAARGFRERPDRSFRIVPEIAGNSRRFPKDGRTIRIAFQSESGRAGFSFSAPITASTLAHRPRHNDAAP
ncbi:hypothetical protein AA0K91_19240, partial [Burkholderia multivorans]|uniref:hypothetical protein n=1 Tax=Burkholderia multivorans TaxID=87883 RepID=UPI003F7E115E